MGKGGGVTVAVAVGADVDVGTDVTVGADVTVGYHHNRQLVIEGEEKV